MQSVAAAMRDAAQTATEHAAKIKQSGSEAAPKALETLSRMTYSSSYALAYDLVCATVFVARALPQDNPVMRGLADGGRAALDGLDEHRTDAARRERAAATRLGGSGQITPGFEGRKSL